MLLETLSLKLQGRTCTDFHISEQSEYQKKKNGFPRMDHKTTPVQESKNQWENEVSIP